MPKVTSDGISIHYEDRGRGLPIVFIHPPVIDSTVFDYQMDVLERDYHVIRFDMQGHGQSESSSRVLTYSAVARDIVRILDELGVKRAVICGYSMGATIALEFALTFPERTLGIISVSGMSEVSTWKLRVEMRIGRRIAKLNLMPLLARAISFGNADTLLTFSKLYSRAKKASPKEVAELFGSGLQYNCTRLLEDIQVPTLIVYGTKDGDFGRYARILGDIPLHEVLEVPKMTHQIPTKSPHELHRAIHAFMKHGLKVIPLRRLRNIGRI